MFDVLDEAYASTCRLGNSFPRCITVNSVRFVVEWIVGGWDVDDRALQVTNMIVNETTVLLKLGIMVVFSTGGNFNFIESLLVENLTSDSRLQ